MVSLMIFVSIVLVVVDGFNGVLKKLPICFPHFKFKLISNNFHVIHNQQFLYMANSADNTDDNNSGNKEDQMRQSRPPIMPFDFARDDIVIKQKKEEQIRKIVETKVNENTDDDDDEDDSNAISSSNNYKKWVDETNEETSMKVSDNISKKNKWIEDPSRPTGYGNVDKDDEDWVPSQDSEGVQKFLNDYFFDSPYDSLKRRDAKSVIRNVTLISGILGTVFTILFYSFPGKFISYRGTADFSQRYSSDFIVKDESELLNDKVNNDLIKNIEKGDSGEYYDDGEGLAAKDPVDSRVPYQKKPSDVRAPGRTENF